MTKCIYFSLLLAIALGCTVYSECLSESDASALFHQSIENGFPIDTTLVKMCVEQSWWNLCTSVIEKAFNSGVNFQGVFDIAVREKNIQIRKLQSFYNANSQKYSVIAPAYQWAEGLEEVVLNVKLAHKWDAPATLGCDDVKVEFLETSVTLEANCQSTGKTFKLNLQLGDKINSEKCSWSKAAVSRIVLNIAKLERGNWSSLLGYGLRPPRNAHTWYSMQEQIKKKDEEMLEAETVEKRLEERRVEKMRREREDRLMEERRLRKKN